MFHVARGPGGGSTVATAEALPTRAPELDSVGSSEVRQGTIEDAVERALEHLLSLQQDDHWCARLEGDSILESEYVMLLWFLGKQEDPRIELACRTLRASQLSEGGWAIYPGGPPDPSASVKAYFVLKLSGDNPKLPHMQRACAAIRAMGGVANTNSFTKIYLAIFEQLPWSAAPAVPPELILTPRWFLLNVAEMSAWSRAIVIPLAMIWALKPRCEVPVRIDELVTGERAERKGSSLRERFWFTFFRGVDRVIKLAEAANAFAPFRRKALLRCEHWTLDHLPSSAGLAAIFPAIANAAVALRECGHDLERGPLATQLKELQKLEIIEGGDRAGRETGAGAGERLRLQPCCSPVWDTALSISASLDAGIHATDERLEHACRWLLEREVRVVGDWHAKCPKVEPSGWYFEYANEFYPDCDDTAEVLALLQRIAKQQPLQPVDYGPSADGLVPMGEAIEAAVERGTNWLLGMQNKDGGWGAFDRGCDRELLTFVPFADHNAMIDPSTVDVTARAIEAIAERMGLSHLAVQRGARFIEQEQESDGSWYGRWGCNYLYGTWLALSALDAVDRGANDSAQRGTEWLLSVQLAGGGWGETLGTYADPALKGKGPATAAQTAWAMMGLLSRFRSLQQTQNNGTETHRLVRAVRGGAEFLLKNQQENGGWRDEQWTGTGFPQVFYLRYHYYDRYFPLQALAQVRRDLGSAVK